MYYRGTKFIGGSFNHRSGWFRLFFVGISYYKIRDWEADFTTDELHKRHTFKYKVGNYLIELLKANFD